MAQADWSELTGSALVSGVVAKGVTAAYTVPNGGTLFTFALHAIASGSGVAGMSCALSGFAPITGSKKAGTISCAVSRYTSGTTCAPVFGLIKGTDPATAQGYLLALTSETSYRIGLYKGAPGSGGFTSTGANLLRVSTEAFTDVGASADTWKHLRLDVLVNPHSEVVLNVYENDLATNAVTAPVWVAIGGMSQYIDDSVGKNTGSLPHLDGFYAFFGMYTNNNVGDMSLFDHIEVARQLTP